MQTTKSIPQGNTKNEIVLTINLCLPDVIHDFLTRICRITSLSFEEWCKKLLYGQVVLLASSESYYFHEFLGNSISEARKNWREWGTVNGIPRYESESDLVESLKRKLEAASKELAGMGEKMVSVDLPLAADLLAVLERFCGYKRLTIEEWCRERLVVEIDTVFQCGSYFDKQFTDEAREKLGELVRQYME